MSGECKAKSCEFGDWPMTIVWPVLFGLLYGQGCVMRERTYEANVRLQRIEAHLGIQPEAENPAESPR